MCSFLPLEAFGESQIRLGISNHIAQMNRVRLAGKHYTAERPAWIST